MFFRVLETNIEIIRITKISWEFFSKTDVFYKCKTGDVKESYRMLMHFF